MTSTDTQFDRRFEDHSGQDLRSEGSTVPAGAQAAPTIAVRLFAGAAAEYGADATTVHARTLQELVDALTAGASERAAQVIARSSFLVDGVARTDRGHELEDGARVDVLPPFAGG